MDNLCLLIAERVQGLSEDLEDISIRDQQILSLHPLLPWSSADQNRVVTVLEALLQRGGGGQVPQQGVRAVHDLLHDP